MQLELGCVKQIATLGKAGSSYSAVGGGSRLYNFPVPGGNDPKGLAARVTQCISLKPQSRRECQDVTHLLGHAFSFATHKVRNTLRYFRWQVPLEQSPTDILNWMILSRGAVVCIVLIFINTSIPDFTLQMLVIQSLPDVAMKIPQTLLMSSSCGGIAVLG